MFIGRNVVGAVAALTLFSVSATPARACHFFDRMCGKPVTTFYAPVAPVVAAPTCCAQPTVVNYVPQTAYRTVIVNQPVTAFQPATACDACGRATTVMRPVTTFVRQTAMVPYTTFRPVVTPVAQPCCGAAPVTATYAPAVAAPVAPPVAAPAPCCGGSAPSTVVTPAPSLSSYSPPATVTTPAPVTSTPVPAGTPGSSLQSLQPTPDPSLNPPASGSSTTPPTFAPPAAAPATETPQSRVLMPPYNPSNTNTLHRHGLDPEQEDRTTAIPLRSKFEVRQASLVLPAKTETAPANHGGWRAAD
jgi:hypothetical protein